MCGCIPSEAQLSTLPLFCSLSYSFSLVRFDKFNVGTRVEPCFYIFYFTIVTPYSGGPWILKELSIMFFFLFFFWGFLLIGKCREVVAIYFTKNIFWIIFVCGIYLNIVLYYSFYVFFILFCFLSHNCYTWLSSCFKGGGGGFPFFFNFLILMYNILRLLCGNLKSIGVKLTEIWSCRSHQKSYRKYAFFYIELTLPPPLLRMLKFKGVFYLVAGGKKEKSYHLFYQQYLVDRFCIYLNSVLLRGKF